MAGHERRDLARVEAGRQLAAHVEQPPQLAGEVLAPGQQPGGLEGRRGLVSEDQQEPLVLAVELVQAELRERDDADRDPVVGHRHDQHRLVDVVGSRDRLAARIGVGVADEDRRAVLGYPAGEALAEPAAEQ